MSTGQEAAESRERRLQDILVALVEAGERGDKPDVVALRAQYPEFADELAEFCAGRARLDQLAVSMRRAADEPTVPHSPGRDVHVRPKVRYFGDYELFEELARGGMGVVYRARQVSLQRTVAVKMILAGQLASEADRQRFRQEAEAAASLDHPNIVPIYEVGEHEGQHYYSMKLIAGGSLRGIADCRAQIADWQRTAARLIAQVARAVHYAHQRGILHRDLKPANILLQAAAAQSAICNLPSAIPMVSDFGLAKRLETGADGSGSGTVVGTAAYMAPEQARAAKRLSTAVDVYSLGAILYELLTGRPPFQAETPVETMLLVLERQPTPPRSIDPAVDRDLETICLKCLEKEPGRRYGSAEALAEDLERWLGGEPIRARPARTLERGLKWARRRPAAAALVAMTILAVIAMASALIVYQQQHIALLSEQQRVAAEEAKTSAQVELAQLRLAQSLVRQAQAERLAGNRALALQLLGEAARLEVTPELRLEAVQAAISPGLRLVHEIPVGYTNSVQFSPDGTLLAVHGVFGTGPGWRAGEPGPEVTQRLKVYRLPGGQLLGDTHLPAEVGGLKVGQSNYWPDVFTQYNRYLLSPQSPLIALPDLKKPRIRIWDAAADRIVAEIPVTPNYLSFRPDGRAVAAPEDNVKREQTRIWELGKQEPESVTFPGVPVHWSAAGQLTTRFVDDYAYRLGRFDVATGKEIAATPPGTSLLMVSGDGLTAAVHVRDAGVGTPVQIWNMDTNTQLATIPEAVPSGHSPYPARFSPDGGYFAIDNPLRPGTFSLWDRATRRVRDGVRGWIDGDGNFNQFQRGAFSPNGALLACYVQQGRSQLQIYDVRNERRAATLRDNHTPVWGPDGRLLATLGQGKLRRFDGEEFSDDRAVVRVWEVIYPQPTVTLPAAVESLDVVAQPDAVLANDRFFNIKAGATGAALVPLEPWPVVTSLARQGDAVWALDLKPIVENSRPVRLRRLMPLEEEVVLQNPAIARRPTDPKDQRLVAVPEKNAWVIDHEGRRLLAVCRIQRVSGRSSWWQHSDRCLVAWDTASGEVLAQSEGRWTAECLALSPDGKLLATGDRVGVTLWDAQRLQRLHSMDCPLHTADAVDNWTSRSGSPGEVNVYSFAVHAVRFRGDGKLLYAASAGGSIDVYDVESRRCVDSWHGHRGRARAVALTADGKLLASGGEDGTIRIRRTSGGKEIVRWDAHDHGVTALAFSSGGRSLASGGGDGNVRLWDLPFIQRELAQLGLKEE